MDKSVSIKKFEEARDYMEDLVFETMTNLEIGIYDPWLKILFEREVRRVIQRQFKMEYPKIDVDFNFSIILAAQIIEFSVQHFYHPFTTHIFLGSVADKKKTTDSKNPYLVDCYYSRLYEAFGEPRIIIRYGHAKKEYEEGSMIAAEQFYHGADTPMAKAYQLAMEAGYVRKP